MDDKDVEPKFKFCAAVSLTTQVSHSRKESTYIWFEFFKLVL